MKSFKPSEQNPRPTQNTPEPADQRPGEDEAEDVDETPRLGSLRNLRAWWRHNGLEVKLFVLACILIGLLLWVLTRQK